jgi:hypothetical protein
MLPCHLNAKAIPSWRITHQVAAWNRPCLSSEQRRSLTGTDPKRQVAQFCSRFALGQQTDNVAPATALGHLRNALSPATRKHVVAELVHDYIHQNNDFVMEKVREKLPL